MYDGCIYRISKFCDDKKADKGIGRPSAHCHVPRKRLHAAHPSQFHRECEATITTVSIQVEHVNRIVPFVCRVTMVIEHPIERVAPWRCASWILGNGYHDV